LTPTDIHFKANTKAKAQSRLSVTTTGANAKLRLETTMIETAVENTI